VRAIVVVWRLLPFVIGFLRDRRRWLLVGRPRRSSAATHAVRARRLTATLAGLGPTFIKLAQVFASRADILPEPYLSELGTLTDRVPPLPVEAIEAVIAAEFERPVRELFTSFDPEPLAAASLGQVHRARVGDRDVAVKVLRPGVDELVRTDLEVAFRILYAVNVLFPSHQTRAISTIVREFAKRIEEEMDFRQEARFATTIRTNFADDPRVVIPVVLDDMIRRRVLVLEFVEGTRIDRLQERIAGGELDIWKVLETIVEVYIRMMLVHGLFHADPHPGNLLVSPDGRIVLLDFGMVVRVDSDTRRRLLSTAMSAVRQDVDGVLSGMYELGMLDPEVDRGTIRDAARALMDIAFTPDTKPRQIERIVNEVMSTFYKWPLMLPSELVYFGRAAALVEGIGMRYDARFNGAQFVTPILHRMRPELTRVVLGDDPQRLVRDWMVELSHVARELRDVLRRAGRDELRVRAHPRDVIEIQQYVGRQVRRILFALLALAGGVVGAVFYLAHRNVYFLVASLGASVVAFLLILVVPVHLLANPFRAYRIRR
jgi:predicted unusual protein kinase regulating ubiquinone biosynthesis (AarF/ABC1/UbiB family)